MIELLKRVDRPHITEKSTRLKDASNTLCFRVRKDCTKVDVRNAIEKLFGVKVMSVRMLTEGVDGHTRLPAYARGRSGTIVECHRGWVYPDSNAHGRGEDPQYLYTVAFDGQELWGPDSEAGNLIHLDLFEPYLLADR